MPKSKRSKLVHLTQTSKKTREHKSAIITDVRDAVDSHDALYLFSYENMRSTRFKSVRLHFRDADARHWSKLRSLSPSSSSSSVDNDDDDDAMMDKDDEKSGNKTPSKNSFPSTRIFLGKNKLLQLALGRTPHDEHADNLHLVSKCIGGSVGLLLTSLPRDEVESYFATALSSSSSSSSSLSREENLDFARAGMVCSRTVTVTNKDVMNHPVSMVEQFRKLGLPVEARDGKVVLTAGSTGGGDDDDDGGAEFVICRKGKVLGADSAKLLVHFGVPLAEFRVELVCRWSRKDGEFETLSC